MSKKGKRYFLRLYITGTRPQSNRAIANIRAVCEEHLSGQYRLEVVDLYQQPQRAAQAQVIAAPTLIKEQPAPLRRMVGDLSDRQRLLAGLNLEARHP